MPSEKEGRERILTILKEHDAGQQRVTPAKKRGSRGASTVHVAGSIIGHGNVVAGGDVLITVGGPKPRRNKSQPGKVKPNPGIDHIDDRQAARLMALAKDVCELESKLKKKPKTMGAIWAALSAKLQVPGYRLIPFEDFARAEKYLSQWIGRLNSMKSAPVVDGDAWRKRYYSYIKINSKNEPEVLAAYLQRIFRVTSLTELDNEELARVYRYVAGRRSAGRGKG